MLSDPDGRGDPARSPVSRSIRLGRLPALVLAVALVLPLLAAAEQPTADTAESGGAASSALRLDLAAALAAAEALSGTLQAEDASIRAARELAVAAGRLPDPELGISIDNLPLEGPNQFSLDAEAMTMRSLTWRQRYTRGAKRDAQSARFKREAESAGATRLTKLANLRIRTARAWLDRHFQERTVTLLERQRLAATRTAASVEAAYRSNRVAQEKVFAARSAIARIDDRLHAARADLANARSTLRRWVGAVGDQALSQPPDISRTRWPTEVLVQQLDRHPDIALMDARERLALAEVAVARAEKSADWTWSVKWGLRDEPFGDMVSVGVSIPLQWNESDVQDRELAAKLELAARVRAEREELRREHRADTERLVASWRANLARLRDYDRSLIPLAEDRSRAAEAAFRSGDGTLAAAVDARRIELDTLIERLRIEREAAFLWAELEYLITDAAGPDPFNARPNEAQQP